MPRTSPVHYINPSAISLTANANGSANDIAVYIDRNAKIKVYSPKVGLNLSSGDYQEWSLRGRNRRLAKSAKKYAIYARLRHNDHEDGYLVFAAMEQYTEGPKAGQWYEKYWHVGPEGWEGGYAPDEDGWAVIEPDPTYWYIKLGEVSLPENHQRTIDLDTGILGTEQFNTEWALNPDSLPLRIEFSCTINDDDAGPTPYVYWGQTLLLVAMLTEGWNGTDIERFDHWEIMRDSGNADADDDWNEDINVEGDDTFWKTGSIELMHGRGAGQGVRDDFNSAVNTTFTVNAMENTGTEENPVYAVLKSASICIMAETWEKYELSLSSQMVTYNPINRTYTPNNGVKFNVRATDQKSNTFLLTNKQLSDAGLVAQYAVIGHEASADWTDITISGPDNNVAEGTVPAQAFSTNKQSINVRLLNAVPKELHRTTIAFLKDGEDSKEREWIFLRSTEAITFGTQEHPYPANISGGQVNPTGAATGSDTNKNQDGWVPQGWWDEQQGVDATNRYEYGAYRDYDHTNNQWGAFSTPKIWNHYGQDGTSPWIASSDKAMDSIQCDVNGTVTAQQSVDVNLSLLHGSAAQSFKIAGIKRNTTVVTSSNSISNMMFVIDSQIFSSLPSAAAAAHSITVYYYPTSTINGKDDIEITLTDANGGNQKVLHFIINGIRPGAKGDPGDDASEVNPNILLRTIFDKGIDFVKEKWTSDWNVTAIDTATDTIVQGRKSIRINMSNSQNEHCDFYQVIYGKLKPSTWYTVSFNYFATQAWSTFLHSNVNNQYPAYYDASAGIIIDGVAQTMSSNNGNWQWPADWTGARHTMTFKTAADLSGMWQNAQLLFRVPQGCQLALCMPKLEDGETATAYMANEDDLVGEGAVNVVISPASMIVEQDINNKDNIAHAADNNLGQFSMQVLKGSTACNITSITASASHVYMSDSPSTGDYTGDNCRTWTPSTPQIANMYLKGIAKDSQNNYYSTGQIVLSITYTDPDTNTSKTINSIIAKVYVNLIGSWSEKVEGDMKTELANSSLFRIDDNPLSPTYGEVVETENWGEFYRSSTQNISIIRQRLGSTNNLLTGALTAEGWDYGFINARGSFSKQGSAFVDSDGYITRGVDGSSDMIVSPNFYLENGKYYTLSFDSIGEEGDTGYEALASLGTRGGTAITLTKTGNHYVGTFLYEGDTVSRVIAFTAYKIFHPQLEEGNTETSFETGDVTSQIKQTADEINLTVHSEMAGANINLLYGVDGYTSSDKLVHKMKAADGAMEYAGAGGKPHIFTSVQLIKGCTYTIQCVTDGNIASAHASSGNPSDRKCTIWLRMDGALNGGYNGECFTSQYSGYENLGGGRHKWTFVCQKTGEYWFRTNSYSDGTTEVTINFWNIKLEGGSSATSFTGNTSQMTSEIKITADEIKAFVTDGLTNTGIDITNGHIDIIANKVDFKYYDNNNVLQNAKVSIDASDGTLHATNVDLSGKIVATDGTIGGFEIGATSIQSADNSHNIVLNNDGTATIGVFSVGASGTSLTGKLTVSGANRRSIEILSNDSWGSAIVGKDNNSERFRLCFQNDGTGYGSIPLLKLTDSATFPTEIKITNEKIEQSIVDPDDAEYSILQGLVGQAGNQNLYGTKYAKGNGASTGGQIVLAMNGSYSYLRAVQGSNGDSAWPICQPTNLWNSAYTDITKGLVHAITLRNLKTILDNAGTGTYYDACGACGVLFVRMT